MHLDFECRVLRASVGNVGKAFVMQLNEEDIFIFECQQQRATTAQR